MKEDEKEPETELPIDNEDDMIETRSNPYHDPSNGRFTSGPGGSSKKGLTSGRGNGKAKFSQKVKMPDESMAALTKGTKITKIFVFAGEGTKKPVEDVKRLAKTYRAPEKEWKKVRGDGYVDMNGASTHVELHWYESKTTGRVEMKVKRELK